MANQLMIVVLALVAIAAVHGANNFILGSNRPGQVHVRTETIIAAPVWNQIVQRSFSYSGSRNISLVQAYDRVGNFTGGFASLAGGGVNQRFVNLNFRSSAVNRGFHFQVYVYGV